MTERARIAIIGTGWWATYSHLPAIHQHFDAEVVALCDRHPARLAKAGEAFTISNLYTDYQEMLSKEILDGAIIVTPHATHYAIARDCLEANLHLLIEKPMTLHAADARHLIQMANDRKREILIGYPYPYYAPVKRAREVLQKGELGKIQFISSTLCSDVFGFLNGSVSPDLSPTKNFTVNSPGEDYNNPELLGGGEGHLQLTHSISTMLFVTDQRAKKVHAMMSTFGLAVDLVDVMIVEFDSGALGTVGGSGNAGRNYEFNLTIYCENGNILLNTATRKGVIRHKDGTEEEDLMKMVENSPSRKYEVTLNFIDVLLNRAPNGSPGELGWRTVELLDAAYRSAAKQGEGISIASLY